MTSWTVRRARAARLFGIALALAGFLPAVSFVGRALLPHENAALAWLPLLPNELALAVLGVALMALGVLIARRQGHVLDAARQRREDAARRVHQYRAEARVEPS
jgi:hypothetical protein